MPMTPSANSLSINARGMCAVSSISRTCGRISRSANSYTLSRKSRSSSERSVRAGGTVLFNSQLPTANFQKAQVPCVWRGGKRELRVIIRMRRMMVDTRRLIVLALLLAGLTVQGAAQQPAPPQGQPGQPPDQGQPQPPGTPGQP